MAAVDVVVAAFGQPGFLRVALRSIQQQDHRDFEVLVADDSKSEENRAVVATLEDERFRYVANAETLGPAGNHRSALRSGNAPFVAILNQDDSWQPGFLRELLGGLERHRSCVAAFSDHEVWDEQGRLLPEVTRVLTRRYGRDSLAPGVHRPFHELVVKQSIPIACATVFRRGVVPADEPPDDSGGAYDLWLAYRLASSGGGVFFSPSRLAAWRRHSASLGERRDVGGTLDIARTWDMIRTETENRALRRHAERQASDAFAQVALRLAANDDRKAARRASGRSLAASRSLGSLVRALLVLGAPASLLRLALGAKSRGSGSEGLPKLRERA